jgi:excisionase family DNA binding protein
MEDPFVTVPQIASELGVNEVTVRTWIRGGRLPAIRAGRTYRVRRSDLERMTMVIVDGDRQPEPSGPVNLESEPLLAQVRLPGDER